MAKKQKTLREHKVRVTMTFTAKVLDFESRNNGDPGFLNKTHAKAAIRKMLAEADDLHESFGETLAKPSHIHVEIV